jgi:hypothetical protein
VALQVVLDRLVFLHSHLAAVADITLVALVALVVVAF